MPVVDVNFPNSSCPGLSRASTSYFISEAKTWMAGTSPAMTKVVFILINQFARAEPKKNASRMIAIPQ